MYKTWFFTLRCTLFATSGLCIHTRNSNKFHGLFKIFLKKSQGETLKGLWCIKLRFKVNCENKYRLLREQLIRKNITRCFGGFVSLNDNKRIVFFSLINV